MVLESTVLFTALWCSIVSFMVGMVVGDWFATHSITITKKRKHKMWKLWEQAKQCQKE